ncbi:MAG: hypothetical protein JSS10_00010 [Verrucomicrobia bacterium]|nr:hypothetical protein [Verrucomicrobiota bacterium]
MWVIVERSTENPEQCWISGVFKKRQDAEEYGSSHGPSELKFSQEVREISAREYPVLFMEDFAKCDFIYVTSKELADLLFAFVKVADEDHVYCNYFIFREDYRGIPGEDCLGQTDHHHVDNGLLRNIFYHGLKFKHSSTRY